jgi:hypothetical protein
VAAEKIYAVEKTDRRNDVEMRSPLRIDSSPRSFRDPSRSRSGIHARQGLAPRTLATGCDFLLEKRAFFGYSKPSPRD